MHVVEVNQMLNILVRRLFIGLIPRSLNPWNLQLSLFLLIGFAIQIHKLLRDLLGALHFKDWDLGERKRKEMTNLIKKRSLHILYIRTYELSPLDF